MIKFLFKTGLFFIFIGFLSYLYFNVGILDEKGQNRTDTNEYVILDLGQKTWIKTDDTVKIHNMDIILSIDTNLKLDFNTITSMDVNIPYTLIINGTSYNGNYLFKSNKNEVEHTSPKLHRYHVNIYNFSSGQVELSIN